MTKKITKEDKIKLIHKNLESGKETILLMDADNILAIKRISINEMAIFYTKNLKSYYKYYNFTDYKVSNETAL